MYYIFIKTLKIDWDWQFFKKKERRKINFFKILWKFLLVFLTISKKAKLKIPTLRGVGSYFKFRTGGAGQFKPILEDFRTSLPIVIAQSLNGTLTPMLKRLLTIFFRDADCRFFSSAVISRECWKLQTASSLSMQNNEVIKLFNHVCASCK